MKLVRGIVAAVFIVGALAAGGWVGWANYQLAMAVSDEAKEFWAHQIFISSLCLAAVGVLQTIWTAIDRRLGTLQLKAIRAQQFTVFDGPLPDIAGMIDKMAAKASEQRMADLDSIRHVVVRAACELVSGTQPRASYFRIEDAGATQRRMVHTEFTYSPNRRDKPTSVFVEDSGVDSGVWEVLRTRQPSHQPDLVKSAPGDLDPDHERKYECYITVAISAAGVDAGVLTVNDLRRKALLPSDVSIMHNLAALLSTAETVAMTGHARNALIQQERARTRGGN